MARENHPEFVAYQKAIAAHPNYKGLPNKYSGSGEVTWVRVGDEERKAWWEARRIELSVENWAEVAREIFPRELNRQRPCQQCGRKMHIDYVYPTKNSLQKLNGALAPLVFEHFGQTIIEIIDLTFDQFGENGLVLISQCFGLEPALPTCEALKSTLVSERKGLSPGVMSNAPDRLDGFHSDNGCHRGESDKGRHPDNMRSYVRDRRAFENWAEGDWCGANALMGKFRRSREEHECPGCGKLKRMTADHIGPISLGFTHRMKFNPLCKECNSRKQNSMTLANVLELIADENSGQVVVSWHSAALWDLLKYRVTSDEEAESLSRLMSTNINNVLWLFSEISSAGFFDFLATKLGLGYADWRYTFTKFDSSTGEFQANRIAVNSLNSEKQKETLLRIARTSLDEFSVKDNRRIGRKQYTYDQEFLDSIIKELQRGRLVDANRLCVEIFKRWAADFASEF